MALTEIPSNLALLESPELRKKLAQHHFEIICSSVALLHSSSLRIGFHAFELKRHQLFGILSYRTEEEAREAAGVGRSSWYANIRLAELFFGVEEELFCSMKVVNAAVLADLPESVRTTEEWVRAAAEDSVKEFRAKVDKELEDKARVSDGKEAVVCLKISMPISRRRVIEEHLTAFAEEMDIEDLGRVLELILEERSQGATLIGSIQKALGEASTLKRMEGSDVSADEALRVLYDGLTGIVAILLAALESLQSEGTS
jgi:hypothetical protein